MEYRKLISFGKSSYVVSLPKQWVRKKGLEKGDSVSIDVNDTNLIIHPEHQSQEQTKKKKINADGFNGEVIKRKIIDAYINNADKITLHGNWHDQRDDINHTLNSLAAMEITQETPSTLTLQTFLNIEDIDLTQQFRKTDHIIKAQFSDLAEVLEMNKIKAQSLSDDITERDQSINRMCFLLLRTINAKLKSLNGVTEVNLPGLWGMTFSLEELGDDLKRIARLLIHLDDEDNTIYPILERIYNEYCDCMRGYFKDDKDLIHEIAEKRDETLNQCDTIRDEHDEPVYVSLTDRLKRLIAKIHSINRISY